MGNYLTFDGISTADYGVEISGEGVFDAPARVYEMIEIPGRNGALSIDQGRFENITVTYPAYNYETNMTDFAESLRDLRNALSSRSGYCRLTDTFHPDEYRLGIFKSGLEVKPVKYNTASEFDLKFDCKPQRFITAWSEYAEPLAPYVPGDTTRGDVSVFEAHPLINLFYYQDASSTITLTIGTFTIEIDPTQHQQTSSGYLNVFIDCDLGEAYEYSEGGTSGEVLSANGWVSFPNGIPVIYPEGGQTITLTGQANTAFVIPRYWRL